MRTKTLLIAAAALVAGVISSNAQVFSANIVGYVDLTLSNGVLANVSPALDLDGTGTNNTIVTVFPNPAIGDDVYAFNGVGYDFIQYKVQGSGHPVVFTTNWFNGVTIATNYPINPGRSVFYLPAANETNTQVGNVLLGTLTNAYFPSGGAINLLSSQLPIAGGLTSVLQYNPTIGDNAYVYAGGVYTFYQYKVQGAGHPVVFTTNWFNGVTVSEPSLNVGQGLWLQPAVNTNWVQTYTNN